MTDQAERVARAVWPVIGSDYTYDEAFDRAARVVDDPDYSPDHHRKCLEFAHELARAAIETMQPAIAEARQQALEEAADLMRDIHENAPSVEIERNFKKAEDAILALLEKDA